MSVRQPPRVSAHHGRRILELLLSIVLSGAAQLLLKAGASDSIAHADQIQWLGFSGLTSAWVWLGILLLIASLVLWLSVLRSLPLGLAYNIGGLTHVLVPVGSLLFFGEPVSMARWWGIAIVLAGVWIIAKPLVAAEERL